MPAAPHLLTFDCFGSLSEGFISTTQFAQSLPFAIKRVFWTYGTPMDVVRGGHAHHQTAQVLIAMQGEIQVMVDAGTGIEQAFVLSSPDKGLFLPPMYWSEIYFSEDALLLSLASTDYNKDDYIRSYDKFLEEIKAKHIFGK